MTERQWLRLATAAQEVLDQVGHPTRAPAHCLERAFALFKFRLVRSYLVAPGVLSYVDFRKKEVVVARNFRQRLEFPSSSRGVYHATLAHELGHVCLHRHQADRVLRSQSWEREAIRFAQVFLVPYYDLMSRSQVERIQGGAITLQNSLWKAVLDLADYYQVTGGFMVRVLAEYGVIRFDAKRRWIEPRVRFGRQLSRVAA